MGEKSTAPISPSDAELDSDQDPKIVISETINPKLIDKDAARIIRRLRRHGFLAYLVGGCVRDLLLDKQPKDFDVITSATPAQVHKLFSNSRIVGRRFRLVHILFSTKVIEVSTFRNDSTPGFFPQVKDDNGDESETKETEDSETEEGEAQASTEAEERVHSEKQVEDPAEDDPEDESEDQEESESDEDSDSEESDEDSEDEEAEDEEDSAEDSSAADDERAKKAKTNGTGRRGRGQRRRSSRRNDRQAQRAQDADPSLYGEPSRDARRRDFGLNALFYDPDNRTIIDYVGGLDDIEKRVIRSIRDADEAMAEDPVRTIRAVRFAAKLNFTIEPATLEAIVRHANKLSLCSQRRLFEEILKILGGGHAAPTVRTLHEYGVLEHLLPEISQWIGDDVEEPEVRVLEDEPDDDGGEDDPQNVPIVHMVPDEVEPDLNLKVTKNWEPSPFMVDAMVQVSWNRRPLEGSNEWHYNPDEDVHDDVFEAAAFQRDTFLEVKDKDLGLTIERAKARSIIMLLHQNKLVEKRISDFVIDNLENGRARQLVEALRKEEEYQPIVSRGDHVMRYLTGLDWLYDAGVPLSTAFVLSVLFAALLEDCGQKELLNKVDQTIRPMVDRNCLSRRDRDQTKRLLALHFGQKGTRQRRSRHRKRRVRPTMTRRSQLNDALLLKWLQCRVTGQGWPEFLHWEEMVYAPATGARSITHRIGGGLEEDWDR